MRTTKIVQALYFISVFTKFPVSWMLNKYEMVGYIPVVTSSFFADTPMNKNPVGI